MFFPPCKITFNAFKAALLIPRINECRVILITDDVIITDEVIIIDEVTITDEVRTQFSGITVTAAGSMRGAIPRKLGWMRGASQATGVGSIPDSHEDTNLKK